MGERRIGRHSVGFESPWLFKATCRGDMDEVDLLELAAELREGAEGQPFVCLLLDLTEAEAMSSEVRKIAAREAALIPYRGIGVFGAPFHARVFLRLLMGAFQVFAPHRVVPFSFFDTEVEARAWLLSLAKDGPRQDAAPPVQHMNG